MQGIKEINQMNDSAAEAKDTQPVSWPQPVAAEEQPTTTEKENHNVA